MGLLVNIMLLYCNALSPSVQVWHTYCLLLSELGDIGLIGEAAVISTVLEGRNDRVTAWDVTLEDLQFLQYLR